VFAEEPGSGTYAAAPKPWRFMMKNSVVQGKGAGQDGPAVDIRGRPRSLVKNVCFQYPGASPSDIEGAGVSNCGFGKQCKSAGLRAPKKVGSGGNLSTIPLNVSYSGAASSGPSQAAKNAFAKTALGAAALIVLVVIGVVVGLPVIAIALGGLASLLLAYILDGD
jgi:hypothetical protein